MALILSGFAGLFMVTLSVILHLLASVKVTA